VGVAVVAEGTGDGAGAAAGDPAQAAGPSIATASTTPAARLRVRFTRRG
jgi:hypothetical protein